jgi:hypothetical protein
MSMLVGWGANEIVNQMNHARPRGSAAQQRDHTLTLAAKQQRLKDIRVDRMHVRVQHSIARVSKCCKYGERCKTTPVSRRARGQSGDRQPDENGYWHTITTKDQIPGWLRGNDYIVGGHPMPTHSYKRSFRLWRSLHMDTMNIWTHFLGSTAFVAAGFTPLQLCQSIHHSSLSIGDTFAFGISNTAATVCFGLSTTFHTLRSHPTMYTTSR